MKRLRHGEYVGGKESAEHSIWRTMMARCNVEAKGPKQAPERNL